MPAPTTRRSRTRRPKVARLDSEAQDIQQIRDRLIAIERSQRWLARKTGTPQQTVNAYLVRRRPATVEWVERARDVLGLGNDQQPESAAPATATPSTAGKGISHVRISRDPTSEPPQPSQRRQRRQQHAQTA